MSKIDVRMAKQKHSILSKVLSKASAERSLTAPPALGMHEHSTWKFMQTLSVEKVEWQRAVKVEFTPQAAGTTASRQEVSL